MLDVFGVLREVGPDAFDLCVDIGKQPALQERVIGEIDPGDDMAGVEGDLLGLGEEVVGIAIEDDLADRLHGDEFFGNDLCSSFSSTTWMPISHSG